MSPTTTVCPGVDAGGGTERQRQTGHGLLAMAGIGTGDEAQRLRDPEPGRGVEGVRGVVRGCHPEHEPVRLQPGHQSRKVAYGLQRVAVLIGKMAASHLRRVDQARKLGHRRPCSRDLRVAGPE